MSSISSKASSTAFATSSLILKTISDSSESSIGRTAGSSVSSSLDASSSSFSNSSEISSNGSAVELVISSTRLSKGSSLGLPNKLNLSLSLTDSLKLFIISELTSALTLSSETSSVL